MSSTENLRAKVRKEAGLTIEDNRFGSLSYLSGKELSSITRLVVDISEKLKVFNRER